MSISFWVDVIQYSTVTSIDPQNSDLIPWESIILSPLLCFDGSQWALALGKATIGLPWLLYSFEVGQGDI